MVNQKTTAVRIIPVIGKTVGDTVEVEAPVGTLQFEILSVEK